MINKEFNVPVLTPECAIVGDDIRKTVLGHISIQRGEGCRIGLKSLNSSFGVKPFEIKRGHPQVSSTVKDKGRVGIRAEVVMLPNKNLTVKIEETRAIKIGYFEPQHFPGWMNTIEPYLKFLPDRMGGPKKVVSVIRESGEFINHGLTYHAASAGCASRNSCYLRMNQVYTMAFEGV